MNDNNNTFIELLKQNTTINEDFISTFFKCFKIDDELVFDIKDTDAAHYLGITVAALKKRLMNPSNYYFVNADYIRVKRDNSLKVDYYLNYQAFERMAMSGSSLQSEIVRNYFVKLREVLTEHQNIIFNALEDKTDMNKLIGINVLYIFVVDNKKNMFKIGQSRDLILRLRNYNIGRIREVDLKYLTAVKHNSLIANYVKSELKSHKIIYNRELYEINTQVS